MTLPFTSAQFLQNFAAYNLAVWPLQLLLTALGVAVVLMALTGKRARLAGILLAGLWAWTGTVYHWMFFTRINGAAWVFGALWIAGALAFAWTAGRPDFGFGAEGAVRRGIGSVLVAYGLVVYPILGFFDGRAYPNGPTFGVPCPVAIVTIGVLWFVRPPVPRRILVAPLLWAIVGSSAAFTLGVREDLGLMVAGASVLALLAQVPGSR